MRPLIQKLAVLPMLTISWACLYYCWVPKKEEDHITASPCPLGFYSEALRTHQCALFLTLIAIILALALSDFQLFILCIVCILKGKVNANKTLILLAYSLIPFLKIWCYSLSVKNPKNKNLKVKLNNNNNNNSYQKNNNKRVTHHTHWSILYFNLFG